MVQYMQARFDASFAALSVATRGGILEQLGRFDASITDLAAKFDMTLTGMKKHVSVLEDAGLVTTKKVGRVRHCKLGPRRLEDETAWITKYRQMLEEHRTHLQRPPRARVAGVHRSKARRAMVGSRQQARHRAHG